MNDHVASTDLIRRDQSLVGLPVVFDPRALGDCLKSICEAPPSIFGKQYVRYKPKTNCLVRYASGSNGDFTSLYAKAYTTDFQEKLAKHQHRVANGWISGEGFWSLPKHRVMVRQFPLDERLRSLNVLANPKTRYRLLRRLITNLPEIDEITLRTLAYKPERRFVAKVSDIYGDHYVLKFYGKQSFLRSLTNLRYLKKTGFDLLPPLLGKSKRRQALALGWRPGQTVRELLVSRSHDPQMAVSIGKALAALHQLSPSESLARWSPEQESDRLRSLAATLAFLVPSYAARAEQLANDICGQIVAMSYSESVIHGDFHSKQILIDDDNVRFLDADELGSGPAQLDVGTFIAHLYRDGLSARISLADVETTVDAFLDGYQLSGGETDEVDLFTALALLKFSHHPFRAGEKEWDVRIQLIVDLAQRFATAAAQNKSSRVRK